MTVLVLFVQMNFSRCLFFIVVGECVVIEKENNKEGIIHTSWNKRVVSRWQK